VSPEFITTALPYLLALTIVIGFLAALTVGIGLGLSFIFLQSMMSSLKKFHINMDQAQEAFEKLHVSTQEQVQNQLRMSEVYKRRRKEQLAEHEAEAERKAPAYPSFTQDWRADRA
jgi:choline-glycine betaine transporter